jgi:protein-tyrosine phosphatase
MWLFDKQYSIIDSGFLKGWTDWHSHILPSVDDGIKTLEDSLRVLDYYEEHGVEKVFLTPHIMADIPNKTSDLRARFEQLKAAYHGPIQLALASENMIDKLFEKRLEEDDLLTLTDNSLLIETSCINPPMHFWEIIDRIKSKGYCPMMAHPERYSYMGEDDYKRLRRKEVELQLNLPAVAGIYGRIVQQKAFWLLKNGMYQCCGSDLHDLKIASAAFERKAFPRKILKAIEETIDF